MMDRDPLVSCDWLAAHLTAPDLVVLDATWRMPGDPADPKADFAAGHVPGAQFYDLDAHSDASSPLPHMLPSPQVFAAGARRFGVNPGDRVVVYDQVGIFSAPRVWWMFRAMGHENVAVLDGGLPAWISEGRPVETGWPTPPHGEFKAIADPGLVADFDAVRDALDAGSAQVIDARSRARFTGAAPEPRPGLRSGHMPGALNLPWNALLGEDGRLRDRAALIAAFRAASADPTRPVIATCGSGVSAAILALALARIGAWRTPVYDGSWTEWAGRADAPIAEGGG